MQLSVTMGPFSFNIKRTVVLFSFLSRCDGYATILKVGITHWDRAVYRDRVINGWARSRIERQQGYMKTNIKTTMAKEKSEQLAARGHKSEYL